MWQSRLPLATHPGGAAVDVVIRLVAHKRMGLSGYLQSRLEVVQLPVATLLRRLHLLLLGLQLPLPLLHLPPQILHLPECNEFNVQTISLFSCVPVDQSRARQIYSGKTLAKTYVSIVKYTQSIYIPDI